MDTKSILKTGDVVEQVESSRLPAGSTLVVNGVHVPHPHAAPNLPGAGDPRVGDTAAVTEEVVDGNRQSKPLAEEVKPKTVVAVGEQKVVTEEKPAVDTAKDRIDSETR